MSISRFRGILFEREQTRSLGWLFSSCVKPAFLEREKKTKLDGMAINGRPPYILKLFN